jgi:hypothetical protein
MSEATPLPTSPVGNALTSITVRPGPYFERINAQRRTIIDVYLLYSRTPQGTLPIVGALRCKQSRASPTILVSSSSHPVMADPGKTMGILTSGLTAFALLPFL